MRPMIATAFLLPILFCSTTLWAAEGCTIQSVHGSPTVSRGDQTLPIQPGDTLQKGDTLHLTPVCQVDMSMNDLAGVRVLGGSELEVAAWKQENMTVRIIDGNIILNLKKLPEQATFRVETPTAIAAVRGTQFWGRVNKLTPENPVTTFAVREGAVEITPRNDSQSFRLEPGKALDIKQGEPASVIRDALPEEMQAMEQAAAIPTHHVIPA